MPTFASLLISVGALAAVPSPLSWNELRELALERNPALMSSQKSREAAKNLIHQAWGGFLPKVSLNADRSRSVTDIAGAETKKTSLSYGARASMNLFNGLASTASLARARAAEAESEATLAVNSANLRRDLRLAYFNLYVIQERLRLFEKDLKRVQQNQKLVELKYNSGSEARWNLKKTKADLERAQFNISSSRSQLTNARLRLAELLGLDYLPDRPLADPDRTFWENPGEISEEGLENHPQLKRSRSVEERTAQDIRTAKSTFLPSIDLSVQHSLTNTQPDSGSLQRTRGTVFAITGEWNLFNGGADYFKIREASLAREAAELTAASTRQSLRSNLLQRQESLRVALGLLPVAKSLREAAEERERTVSEQYRSGLKNYLDWEQAESQLLETEQSEIKALGDSLTALAELELARGFTLEQP